MTYIVGFNHGYELAIILNMEAPPNNSYCIPQKVTNGQITRVVIKYLKDHPEQLHTSARKLILFALDEGFPCWTRE